MGFSANRRPGAIPYFNQKMWLFIIRYRIRSSVAEEYPTKNPLVQPQNAQQLIKRVFERRLEEKRKDSIDLYT